MMAPFDNIVQHLFHQPSLQSVTVGELERMVEQHPSFAAAQFLLLKKMQETAHPDFTSQLRKTTLYFNNPLWLQFLLQPQREKDVLITGKEEPVIDRQEAQHVPAPDITGVEEPIEQNTAFTEEPAITVHEPIAAGTGSAAPLLPEQQEEEEFHRENNTTIAEQYNHQPLTQTTAPDDEKAEEPAYEAVSAIALAEEYNYHSPVVTETAAEELNEAVVPESNEINTGQDQAPPPIENSEHHFEPTSTGTEKEEPVFIKTIIETPAAKDDMLFEPYHTIDYFASQGIKLSKIDPEPQDKLGRQLKSFTEWLKGMKKLPQASVNKILAENEESEVVADASHSIEIKEVITEAMAEVFEKQGLHEKAAEVYQKLSLQNPSKSAYFASRIEALKQQ